MVSVLRWVMSSAYSFLARIDVWAGVQPPELGANRGVKSNALRPSRANQVPELRCQAARRQHLLDADRRVPGGANERAAHGHVRRQREALDRFEGVRRGVGGRNDGSGGLDLPDAGGGAVAVDE